MHLIIILLPVVQIVQDLLLIDVHGLVIDVDLRLGVVMVRACPAFSEQQHDGAGTGAHALRTMVNLAWLCHVSAQA
mgnify:CR=1 FL=1